MCACICICVCVCLCPRTHACHYYATRPISHHSPAPTPSPSSSGGALKFGVGAKPQPPQTRPFGRVRPASLGGGAGEPAGRRRLSQGHPQAPARPLRAHERRAASTSAARSVRAPLAASVEAKHTLSTDQAGRCSRCAWLLLRQPGARALSARPTCLPYASAPRGAAVASGLEPARPGGTAPRGPWVAGVAGGGAVPLTAGTGRRKSPADGG